MDHSWNEENTLTITRYFNAPRELVWKAWNDEELFKQWLGPKGFSCPYCKIDFRPGGKYLHCMKSPEGEEFWSTGMYKEIRVPERIVSTDSFADKNGNVIPGSEYGLPADFPLEMMVTLTFKEQGNGTNFSLQHAGLPSGEILKQTGISWNESFDKLDQVLSEVQKTVKVK